MIAVETGRSPFPAPVSLHRTLPGQDGDRVKGPVVFDDDWVVKKFAQIRRRSRSIDSAIPLSFVQTPEKQAATATASPPPTTSNSADRTTKASGNAPVQLEEGVTLQPLLPRASPSGDGLDAESRDTRLSPLPPLGDGAVGFFPPAPKTIVGLHNNKSHEIKGAERTILQESVVMMPTSSSNLSDIVPNRTINSQDRCERRLDGDEEVTHDDGADGDSVVAAVPEDDRERRTGSAAGERIRPTEIPQESTDEGGRAKEEQKEEHLRGVTPDERALSLPSSSLLVTDGSGELGLGGRSARWDAGQEDDGNGKTERGTVWSKRWVLRS